MVVRSPGACYHGAMRGLIGLSLVGVMALGIPANASTITTWRTDATAALEKQARKRYRPVMPPRKRYRPPPRPPRPYPSSTAVYSVPVGQSPVIGRRDALVTIVVGVDFMSPYSDRIRATFETLHKKYANELRFVFKQFVVYNNRSTDAALAACAAHRQGKYFEMEHGIWTLSSSKRKGAHLEQLARRLKLNVRQFRRDMRGSFCRKRINDERAELQRVGARGVPASYVNGRYLTGAQPVSRFVTLIDEELRKARQRLRSGTQRRTYYRTWIVQRGRRNP